MKADAKPSAEQEALAWAIEEIGDEGVEFSRNASKILYHDYVTDKLIWRYDTTSRRDHDELERWLVGVIDEVKKGVGEFDFSHMQSFAATLILRGDRMPVPLRHFAAELLQNPRMPRPRKKTGPSKDILAYRNFGICRMIADISDRFQMN